MWGGGESGEWRMCSAGRLGLGCGRCEGREHRWNRDRNGWGEGGKVEQKRGEPYMGWAQRRAGGGAWAGEERGRA